MGGLGYEADHDRGSGRSRCADLGSAEAFARELKLAAAIFWYDRGLISQGKGAELAGMTRVEFIDALGKAGVDAIQTSVEELRAERDALIDAGR